MNWAQFITPYVKLSHLFLTTILWCIDYNYSCSADEEVGKERLYCMPISHSLWKYLSKNLIWRILTPDRTGPVLLIILPSCHLVPSLKKKKKPPCF